MDDGEVCVIMAQDASIEERLYVDEHIVKTTWKIELGRWEKQKMLMSWKEWPSHFPLAHMSIIPFGESRRELNMVAHWRMSLQDCISNAVDGGRCTTTWQERAS
uniref:Uncharacterized protein n=1 Tax=Arundo donax TaxID=35708 RepID=A0A0A8ZNR9_ARUDO